jgi:hypothetical protein
MSRRPRLSGERIQRVWRIVQAVRESQIEEWVEHFLNGGVYDQAFFQRAMRQAMKTEARHLLAALYDEAGLRAVVSVQRIRGKKKLRVYKIRADMTSGDHRQVATMHGGKARAHVRLRNAERHQLQSHFGVQLSLFELVEILPGGQERRTRGD